MNEQEQVELLTGRLATLTEHFNMIRDNVKKIEQEHPEFLSSYPQHLKEPPTYPHLDTYKSKLEKLKYQIRTFSDHYVKLMDVYEVLKDKCKDK